MQMNLELPEEFSEELKKTVIEVLKESLVSFSTDSKYPEFMDKTQCASYLSISIGTFNNWLKNEKIPFTLIGGSYRFKKSEINKFMLSKQK